jgi:platelet-activating factor acetylhydrolase IB subunit alpha
MPAYIGWWFLCSLRFWQIIKVFAMQIGHDNWVRGVVIHPAGKHIISVSDDKTMRIWDLRTGRCTRAIDAHSHFVTCVAISDAAHLVGTGGVDQVVKVWNCH